MAINGPKFQFTVNDLFDFQYDTNGRITGVTMNQGAATFFATVQQITFAVSRSGSTVSRPTSTAPAMWVGRPYFDTDLNYPIWWDGTQWVDATGTPV